MSAILPSPSTQYSCGSSKSKIFHKMNKQIYTWLELSCPDWNNIKYLGSCVSKKTYFALCKYEAPHILIGSLHSKKNIISTAADLSQQHIFFLLVLVVLTHHYHHWGCHVFSYHLSFYDINEIYYFCQSHPLLMSRHWSSAFFLVYEYNNSWN